MNKLWKSKYFEKNNNESHSYIFKSLEIKQYLQKILKNQGFALHDYKLNFNNSVLNIFISIYKTERAFSIDKEDNSAKEKASNLLKKKIKKFYKQKNFSSKLPTKVKYTKLLKFYNTYLIKLKKSYKQKYLMNQINKLPTKTKHNEILKICDAYLLKLNLTRTSVTLKTLELNNFSKKILKSLNLFTNNRFNLALTVQEINYINGNPKTKQILLRLRKFERTTFYNEGKRFIIPFITQPNSAKLLTQFISTQIRTIKRHNFFFNFLKETLNSGINQKSSRIQGIKLIIKGRLNNAARAKHRIITIGKIPLTTINSNIDYSESVAFTSNGTLGIKVWVCEKVQN